MENAPNRILIIDTAWIGDVVLTTALIGSVRATWPRAEIHVMVAARCQNLLLGHPHISRVWIFDKHGVQAGLSGLFDAARPLREVGFNVVFNAHPSFRSRVLTSLIGSPIRIGYRGFASSLCFTHTIGNDLAIEPDHVERRLNLLRVLNPNAMAAPLLLRPDPAECVSARTEASQRGWNGLILGLVPGSAWTTKRWPDRNYIELAGKWLDETTGGIIAAGGTNEQGILQEIQQLNPGRCRSLIDEPLPRVIACLSTCSDVVGNDTGISFAALAAGAKRVHVLYGCTQINYAFPAPHRAIHAGVPCCLPRTGHGQHRCRWTGGEPWCMNQITVEQIWRSLRSE